MTGLADGALLGLTVGFGVFGLEVGFLLGEELGDKDGEELGFLLGEELGDEDGLSVGFEVTGLFVGSRVGDCVGPSPRLFIKES